MGCISRSRAMEGWLAGCVTATTIVCVYPMLYSMFSAVASDGGDHAFGAMIGTAFFTAISIIPFSILIFLITCLLTGIPAAAVIWLGKKFQMRSLWFFAGAGAGIGGLSQIVFFSVLLSRSPGTTPLFALAGLIAGVVYWWAVERR